MEMLWPGNKDMYNCTIFRGDEPEVYVCMHGCMYVQVTRR